MLNNQHIRTRSKNLKDSNVKEKIFLPFFGIVDEIFQNVAIYSIMYIS